MIEINAKTRDIRDEIREIKKDEIRNWRILEI